MNTTRHSLVTIYTKSTELSYKRFSIFTRAT